MAPEFVLCSCKQHGRIVLGDGFPGPEYALQQQAEHLVTTGLAHERFTEAEAVKLRREIFGSGLPRTVHEVDLVLCWQIECWNRMRHEEEIIAIPHCLAGDKEVLVPVPDNFKAYLQGITGPVVLH